MIRKIFIVVLSSLALTLRVQCQTEQLVINVSPASIPGVLTFENPKGSIKVTGYDGEVILVTGTLRFSENEKVIRDGLHRIEQNAIDISAEVQGNNFILQCKTTGKTVDFDIKVPRNFSLKLRSLNNGKIEVLNTNGEIEAENSSGDISLENIAGSAVLSTVYGKISAVFRKVSLNSPMMFTSFEGDVTLTLPESINASLKMKSEKGEILSDFDIVPVKRQPVIKKTDNTQVYSLEDWVVGKINEGGPEYVIKSYNGNVYVRKK